jgi:hypothetical protein
MWVQKRLTTGNGDGMHIPFCSKPVNLTFNLIEIKVIRLMVGLIYSPIATWTSNIAEGGRLDPTVGVVEFGPGELIVFTMVYHNKWFSS